MADTKIQWATKVWNPVTGCTKVSEGCRNCYAERMAHRLRGRCGYPADDPFRVTLHPEKLGEPLRWRSTQIFVCSMGDLFHEDIPFEFIDEVFKVMAFEHTHRFMILTKRPDRMEQYITSDRPNHKDVGYNRSGEPINWPLRNLWPGVTAENRPMWDARTKLLKQTPAAKHFVSYEPALGPLDDVDLTGIDWVICGGESGPNARPMHPDWVRSLQGQCQAAGVPYFFKQWGEWAYSRQPTGKELLDARKELIVPVRGEVTTGLLKYGENPVIMARVGKKAAGDLLDGKRYHEFPEVSK